MKRTPNLAAVAAAITVGLLAGCSQAPPPRQARPPLESQRDDGRLLDYLEFAGLSYGDKFDKVKELFGEPTKVSLNDGRGGEPYYSFVSNYYDIEGERCLDVSYDKVTRRVRVVQVRCDKIRILLLKQGIDDPKLALFGEHRDRIFARYGPRESSSSQNYYYNYGDRSGPRGLVDFICYDFWDGRCKTIYVQWFY